MSCSYVRHTGLVCPVGLVAATACAAIRCNINRIEELNFEDQRGEPYYASAMPDLQPGLSGRERVLALLTRSLDEAIAPVGYGQPVAVFLVLPTIFADADLSRLIRNLVVNFQSPVDLDVSQVLLGGPVTAFEALARAQATLASGRVAACVVATSDSFVSPRRLLELEQTGRLRRPDDPDGVIPGEAAACVLIDRFSERALASLAPPGFGNESATLWNDLPHRGDGLVEASTEALAASGYALADMDTRISDGAGESFDFREQALVVSRLLDRRKQSFPLLLPCAVLGEIGVAGPLCGVVKAIATYQRGYAAGPRTLVFARDHQGPRAAVVVEAPQGRQQS